MVGVVSFRVPLTLNGNGVPFHRLDWVLVGVVSFRIPLTVNGNGVPFHRWDWVVVISGGFVVDDACCQFST